MATPQQYAAVTAALQKMADQVIQQKCPDFFRPTAEKAAADYVAQAAKVAVDTYEATLPTQTQ